MKLNQSEEKIDIVILWVDGNDPNWLEEKNKYAKSRSGQAKNRFRDFGNLQYLFRGIEKYAPWVNKVFFITWGHLPKFLDVNNQKLEIVKHEDFIPREYLPTFSSNVIEMNLHRIKNLSSKFVLFNDDLFILRNLKKEDFFENGLPKDRYVEYLKKNCSKRHEIMKRNYLEIINKYFSKQEFIKKNFSKVFNIKYGLDNLKTLEQVRNDKFDDFYSEHLTQAFLKSTFEEVWEKEWQRLDDACHNKFRADNDIGNPICRYWQLLTGNFKPSRKMGKYYEIDDNNDKIISAIKNRKYKIICINDAKIDVDFEKAKKEINIAFETIFKEKSSFEK